MIRTILSILLCTLIGVSCTETSDITRYRSVKVNFFTDHPDFVIVPAEFETVSEEVLHRTEHECNNTVWDTIMEVVLLKEGFKEYINVDTIVHTVIYDSGLEHQIEFQCFIPKKQDEFSEVEISPTYESRTYYLAPEPTSDFCVRSAQYRPREYKKVASDATIIPRTDEPRSFHQQTIFVPTGKRVIEFFEDEGIICDPSMYEVVE